MASFLFRELDLVCRRRKVDVTNVWFFSTYTYMGCVRKMSIESLAGFSNVEESANQVKVTKTHRPRFLFYLLRSHMIVIVVNHGRFFVCEEHWIVLLPYSVLKPAVSFGDTLKIRELVLFLIFKWGETAAGSKLVHTRAVFSRYSKRASCNAPIHLTKSPLDFIYSSAHTERKTLNNNVTNSRFKSKVLDLGNNELETLNVCIKTETTFTRACVSVCAWEFLSADMATIYGIVVSSCSVRIYSCWNLNVFFCFYINFIRATQTCRNIRFWKCFWLCRYLI